MFKSLLMAGGMAALPFVITLLLPRKKTDELGAKLGRFVSRFLRLKVGSKFEVIVENTLIDISNGFERGLKEDNERKDKKAEEKTKLKKLKNAALNLIKRN